jgi:arabinofuranan 3-O-arabinosyltransferase
VTAGQQSYLVVNENYNPGWQAQAGRTALKPVRLDGWKQGWIIPAGTDSLVTLTYKPDTIYRDALFGGLSVVVLFIVISLIPARRTARLISLPPLPVLRAGGRIRLAAVLALSAAAGMWLAGYSGAGVMLVSAAGFVAAARQAASRAGAADGPATAAPRQPDGPARAVLRAVLSPVLVIVLVVVASAMELAGMRVQQAGGPQALVDIVYDAVPQVLCLIAIARIIAEFASRASAEAPW